MPLTSHHGLSDLRVAVELGDGGRGQVTLQGPETRPDAGVGCRRRPVPPRGCPPPAVEGSTPGVLLHAAQIKTFCLKGQPLSTFFLSIKFTEKEKSKSPGGCQAVERSGPALSGLTSWRPPSLLCAVSARDSGEARIHHCSRQLPPREPRRRRGDKGGTSRFQLLTETASAEMLTLPHGGHSTSTQTHPPFGAGAGDSTDTGLTTRTAGGFHDCFGVDSMPNGSWLGHQLSQELDPCGPRFLCL